MTGGFIKLHRKMLEWEWYDDGNVVRAFLHCLFKANWKSKKWRGILIERGSFFTSYSNFGKQTRLSVRQVRGVFDKLKSTSELTIKPTSKGLLVTVCKYEDYQRDDRDDRQANDKQTDRQTTSKPTGKRQSNDNQTTTIEEGKEGKEGKEDKKKPLSEKSDDVEILKNPILDLVEAAWKNSPANARNRSSKEKVKAAFSKIKASDRPGCEEIERAIQAWSKSADWIKDDGQFVQGLHIWVNDKKWEDLPEVSNRKNDNSSF